MNQSFGSWMLTGGTRGPVHEEARQFEHLRAVRELQSERRAARRAELTTAFKSTVEDLRARFAGRPSATTPDCCPA